MLRNIRGTGAAMTERYPERAFSTHPANYQLIHFNCLAELYTPRDGKSEASLGTAVRRVQIFAEISESVPQ